jgi:hypothetical protein
MTRRRLTRTAASLVLAAVGAVTLSIGAAAPAQAAPPELLLSLDGSTFSPTLGPGLFDGLGSLVPGESLETSLWVMNSSTDPGVMRVTVADLVIPSFEFGSHVTLTADDGVQLITESLSDLANCSIVVPSRSVSAGGVVRIDMTISMSTALTGLQAQSEAAQLDLGVALRDAATGVFPAVNGCPAEQRRTPTASDPLAFTGAVVLPTLGFAAALLVGGLLLVFARRRRRDDDEVSE